MASRPLHRRQFLSGLVTLGGAALTLPACQTLDRIVLGDFKDESERIVILGGGLAGLMAGYQLKKENLNFRLYEAGPRIGGRVYSIPEFMRGQNVAELGAEFFTADQKLVLQIAEELRLETIELSELNSRMRIRRGPSLVNPLEVNRELQRLQRSVSKSETPEKLRALSLKDWLNARSKETFFLDYVNAWTLEKYGTTCDEVSAEVFATKFDRARPPLALWTEARLRFRGGTSALAQALFDRTAGFQPERTYSFQHKLKAIRRKTRGMDLIFDTPDGERSVFARNVICALPMAALAEIDGIKDFPAPWDNASALKVGNHTKLIYSYNERFWGEAWDQTKLLRFGNGQVAWESSYRLNPLFQFRQGAVSVLWGGQAAKSAGPAEQQGIQRDFETLFNKKPEVELMDQAMMNWAQHPHIKGSVSYPRPGGRPDEWDGASEDWVWAGEHSVWADRGTLQGALDSGMKAAAYVVRNRPQRFFPV